MSNQQEQFSGKLRLRACGLLIEEGKLLVVKLLSPITDRVIWMPPGGGVHFEEGLEEALKREFLEEVNVEVRVGRLLHVQELIKEGFHAIECYFKVYRRSGKPELGTDPELAEDEQLLQKLELLPIAALSEYPFVPKELIPKLQNQEGPISSNIFGSQQLTSQ